MSPVITTSNTVKRGRPRKVTAQDPIQMSLLPVEESYDEQAALQQEKHLLDSLADTIAADITKIQTTIPAMMEKYEASITELVLKGVLEESTFYLAKKTTDAVIAAAVLMSQLTADIRSQRAKAISDPVFENLRFAVTKAIKDVIYEAARKGMKIGLPADDPDYAYWEAVYETSDDNNNF